LTGSSRFGGKGRGAAGEASAPTDADDVNARPSELLETLRKLVRSTGKVGARLDAMDAKLDTGFAEVRSRMETLAANETARWRWDDLLDALDALDRARESAGVVTSDGMRDGLRAVSERLELFLRQAGIARIADTGGGLDGRLFRVVGTETRADLGEGSVVRVVRAAARTGNEVVREGEVIVSRRSV